MARKKCMCKVRPKTAETHYRCKGNKDGWDTQCKTCNNKRVQRYRKGHRKHLAEKTLEYTRTHTVEIRERQARNRRAWQDILEARNLTSCNVCNYNECWAAIDFHHIDPGKKEFNIGDMFNDLITDKRLEELDKTVPLCKNCHAKLHWDLKKEERDAY